MESRPWPARTGVILVILLVILQFGLVAMLAWRLLTHTAGFAPIDAVVLLCGAVILGLWTLSANRPGNFNIRPVPRSGGTLIVHGPYRRIRHPMYVSLMLAGLGAARVSPQAVTALTWPALALVLTLKAVVEERMLILTYPEYRDYCAKNLAICSRRVLA